MNNSNKKEAEKLPDSNIKVKPKAVDKLPIELCISSEDLLNIRDSWNIVGGKISKEDLQFYNTVGNLLVLPALKQRIWTVT